MEGKVEERRWKRERRAGVEDKSFVNEATGRAGLTRLEPERCPIIAGRLFLYFLLALSCLPPASGGAGAGKDA